MNLVCIGLSHHTANVATREQFAGNATADSITRHAGCAEALLLTTCNRVEVYAVSEQTDFYRRNCALSHRRDKSQSGQLCASILSLRGQQMRPASLPGRVGTRLDGCGRK